MNRIFDEETGFINLDELIMQRPSYRKIVEDKIVTPEELKEQADLVIGLLKQIDEKLSENDRKLVIDALCELSVLNHLSNR